MRLALALLTVLAVLAGGPVDAADVDIALVGEYLTGREAGDEIVSVQSATRRAVLSNSEHGTVDLLDLRNPAKPVRLARYNLDIAAAETLTSVAFHPRHNFFVAAIQGAGPLTPGRLEIRSAENGRLLRAFPAGVGPDCVAIDPTGRFAVSANEGEPFVFDPKTRRFHTAEGSLTLVRFADSIDAYVAVPVRLPPASRVPGMVRPEDGRMLEREVDLDGDGKISDAIDLDGDGTIESDLRVIGTFRGQAIVGTEAGGETLRIPVVSGHPTVLEPEVVAFSRDGTQAYVSIQESNGFAVLNTSLARVIGYIGFGTTKHAADLDDDGKVKFDDTLVALREPDGLAVTPDGMFVVTADEGDTVPESDEGVVGKPAAGGRTVSVVSLYTGVVLGDTGNGLDAAAHAAGVYPDKRSDRKGSEPEMVVTFAMRGTSYAVVGLERAGAVALISLRDPTRPRVLKVVSTGRPGSAPEGLAVLRDPENGAIHVLTANENDGTVSVFRVTPRD